MTEGRLDGKPDIKPQVRAMPLARSVMVVAIRNRNGTEMLSGAFRVNRRVNVAQRDPAPPTGKYVTCNFRSEVFIAKL